MIFTVAAVIAAAPSAGAVTAHGGNGGSQQCADDVPIGGFCPH